MTHQPFLKLIFLAVYSYPSCLLIPVIGPNKVWQFSANGGTSITPFTPENFWDFLGSLPKDGNQLFGVSGTNW